MGKSVQHEEIYLWSNFRFNPLSHIGVDALLDFFLLFFMLFLSKILFSDTIWPIGTKLGLKVPWDILHSPHVTIFDPSKNMAITKNRT